MDERTQRIKIVAPANAGPNVEALIVDDTATPTADNHLHTLYNGVSADTELVNAEPCFAKTGIFFDLDESPASIFLTNDGDVERNLIAVIGDNSDDIWFRHTNAFKLGKRSPVKNFSVEHVVWKRMDGGNLSLPAVNARGMGKMFITRGVVALHMTLERKYTV